MRIAICPGSFDPPTNGHLDIIRRAAAQYDAVIAAVLPNYNKKNLFTLAERCRLLSECIKSDKLKNVTVEYADGLLADFAVQRGACAVVKGLRSVSDFDYEMRIALGLKKIAPTLETVFLMSDERSICISSDIVRSVAAYGGDISAFVPSVIKQEIIKKFNDKA